MIAPPQARAVLGQFLVGNEEVGYRIGVPSVWPSGSSVTITGQAITGQKLTGATPPPAQFGTVTTRLGGPPQTKTVTGIASPQAFGSIKTALTKPISAVNSAQAFGVPTAKATVTRAVVGVPSAQAFGTPVLKAVIKTGAGGVASAQAFGTPTLKAIFKLAVTAIASAQSFGTVTTRTGFTRSVGSVGSAQAFGVPRAVVPQSLPLAGIASPQAFGSPTIKGSIKPTLGGVPSAQAFGSIHPVYRQFVTVTGIPTAQAFGTADLNVFNVWLHDASCLDDDLLPAGLINLDLALLECLGNENVPICGVPICGDGSICGGSLLYTHASDCLEPSPVEAILNKFLLGEMRVGQRAVVYVTSSPPPLVLDLQPAGVT